MDRFLFSLIALTLAGCAETYCPMSLHYEWQTADGFHYIMHGPAWSGKLVTDWPVEIHYTTCTIQVVREWETGNGTQLNAVGDLENEIINLKYSNNGR